MRGNPLLTKNAIAEAVIVPNSILAFGTNEGEAITASTQNFNFLGVSDNIGQDTIGDRIDYDEPFGIGEVQIGADVNYGDELINQNGKAVPLSSGTPGLATVIGIAKEAATADAFIRVSYRVYKVTIS